jgi:iron-sulfur cluster repair protein YtfE (RIC family)
VKSGISPGLAFYDDAAIRDDPRRCEHMKRAAGLRELSDDHHRGLVQARRFRRAAHSGEADTAEEAARAFLGFWQIETSDHFRKEEEVLLPVLARHGGDMSRGPVVEMLAQHAQIRNLVIQLSDEVRGGSVQQQTLLSTGEILESHIRLEERKVFPRIEEVLPGAALEELASRLSVKEAGPHTERWVPVEGLYYDSWPGPGDSEGGGWD